MFMPIYPVNGAGAGSRFGSYRLNWKELCVSNFHNEAGGFVSGLYDVLLEGHKPRFGEQRRKKVEPALAARVQLISSFMVPPSISSFNSSSGMPALLKSATARPAIQGWGNGAERAL